ncbi:hypothetical protein P3T16_003188 [Paraburkholderia sp. GAS42]
MRGYVTQVLPGGLHRVDEGAAQVFSGAPRRISSGVRRSGQFSEGLTGLTRLREGGRRLARGAYAGYLPQLSTAGSRRRAILMRPARVSGCIGCNG